MKPDFTFMDFTYFALRLSVTVECVGSDGDSCGGWREGGADVSIHAPKMEGTKIYNGGSLAGVSWSGESRV